MTDCKLCGRSEISKITAAAKTYYHCAHCSLIFIDETGLPGPEAERKRYLEHHNTHENDGYVKMLTEFLNHLVTPYLQNIFTALDFGCGPTPVLADLLAKRGLTADVYDPYFYPEATYKMKSYDLITATEVFEHLSDPYWELSTLKDHLNAGGYLAVRTMFHPGPEKFAGWWYHRDPTHVCFYNSDTFDWIAAHFALRIVFRDGKILPVPEWRGQQFQRLLNNLSGFRFWVLGIRLMKSRIYGRHGGRPYDESGFSPFVGRATVPAS